MPGPADLHEHGDRQVPAGSIDLAVNVLAPTPDWLRDRIAQVRLDAYPDMAPGIEAAAARHALPPDHCLLAHGAAEAFWLIAQGLRPRLAACVHPSFTAPEAALRAAGVSVLRVHRDAEDDFALDAAAVPAEADLVVIGRPDNPTGRVEDLKQVRALTRPGRVVVIDEAFADFLPEASGLASLRLPGVLCVRSLTKLWGLAGLRVGYVLGEPTLLDRLEAARQPWPVSAPAVSAVSLVCAAEQERYDRATAVAEARTELMTALAALPVRVHASPANFLLLRSDTGDVRTRLLADGIAVRRAAGFPGLDDHYVRVAVSLDPDVRARFVAALATALGTSRGPSVALPGVAPTPPAPAGQPAAAPVRSDLPTPSSDAGSKRSLPPRTLILGGARSGKSRHAQGMLAGLDVLYVATGGIPDGGDQDWAARVCAHRTHRPAHWTTVETTDVAAALRESSRPVLVECLATWMAATMAHAGAWDDGAAGDGDERSPDDWRTTVDDEVGRLLAAWRSVTVPVVAVSNEVGLGVVPATRSGVLFRDALGRLNQQVAAESDDVRLMVAGCVQYLTKGWR